MKRNWTKRGMAMMLAALMCCMCAAPAAAASAEEEYAEETAVRDDSAKRKIVFQMYDEKRRRMLDNHAFSRYENVEMIVLGDGIKAIYPGAFRELDSLKKVLIPASVSEIEVGAFGSNTRQPVIYTEKDSYAYQHAKRYMIQTETEKQFCLQSEGGEAAVVQADLETDFESGVSLHATVTTDKAQMGSLADGFEEAAALYKLALIKDGEKIQSTEKMYVYLALPDEINGTYADYYSVGEDGSLTELVSYTDPYTPQQGKTIEMNGLSDVLVITGHKTGDVTGDFVIEDGVLKSYVCSDPIVFVPDGVEKIASGVLYHEYYTGENKILENVKHAVLPEGLKEIQFHAFARYSLESVVIPDSIEVIADDAFAYPPDPPIYPPLDQSGTMPITIYGKTLTVAESYATKNKDHFIPTNTQLRGDVNGSGDFEAEDALGILRMVVGLEPKFGYSADMDEDGSVTAADALGVLRIVVGLED